MNLLLDTHVWIWSVSAPSELSAPAREAIEHGEHRLHVSTITFWEVAMLAERDVLDVDGSLDAWLAYALGEYPMIELPLTREIAVESRRVPLKHGDPADRFITATASLLDLVLVTRDRRLLTAEGITTLGA